MFHPLRVVEVRPETADAVSLNFEVPAELAGDYRFLPGQHLTLRARLGERELRRSYSICAAPFERELRVVVKRVPGGQFSTWVHDHVRAGSIVEVLPPAGGFVLAQPGPEPRHDLALCAGSGITPIRSILMSVLAANPENRFTLVYGNRSVSSIIFREDLEDTKNAALARFVVYHVLSRERRISPLLSGHVRPETLGLLDAAGLAIAEADAVWLCGPEPMAADLRAALHERGVPPHRVHTELFGTPALAGPPLPGGPPAGARRLPDDRATAPATRSAGTGRAAGTPRGVEATGAAELTVRWAGLERTVAVPAGVALLDAAVAAGLDLPYSCKGGVCATCRARLCAGEVDMAANYALDPDEVAAGFVLTCQARARSARVVVDYDQG